jgi:predicted nucleic acid-binding protein
MNFVLDPSLALSFAFRDEATAETDEILDSLGEGAKGCVPALWRWEVGNALLMAERRKRISQTESQRHLMLLGTLPVEVDESAWRQAWQAGFFLASRHRLSLYDGAYLELSMRRGLPLGSLDRDLREAARTEGVSLLPVKMKGA